MRDHDRDCPILCIRRSGSFLCFYLNALADSVAEGVGESVEDFVLFLYFAVGFASVLLPSFRIQGEFKWWVQHGDVKSPPVTS